MSARKIMSFADKLKQYIPMLSTSIIAPILPDFTEDYGEDKNIDIKISVSKAKFLEGFPNTKPTGIAFDKNGNCKI